MVGLATLLPVLILILGAQLAILGPAYYGSVIAALHDPTHAAKYTAEQLRITDAQMPLLLGFGFVITPITNGLIFAPAAYAYRVLSGKVAAP